MTIPPERVLRALDRRERPWMAPAALLRALRAERRDERRLASILRRLVQEGKIERQRGRYRIAREAGLVDARVQAVAPGVAQAVDESGERWEVVGAWDAVPGERIVIEPSPGPAGRAELVRTVGGPRREWVGVLVSERGGGIVRPWRSDAQAAPPGGRAVRGARRASVMVPRAAFGGARPGDVVVAVAEDEAARPRGKARRAGRGRREQRRPADEVAVTRARVVEVLGPLGTPEADFRAVAWRHRLALAFPEAVLAEAACLDAALDPAEVARRLDLRARPFVTIDPATARDHDDAVFVEREASGHRLWVAIADVAHHVAEGSALDREARRRGNSVYFPDRAIPMLPERLSGDLCSLRPGVDRLVLAVEMAVARDGAVRSARFHEAVLRSRARLVYDEAAAAMGGRAPATLEPDVREQLALLAALAQRLMALRFAAGAIDFDLPTAEIVLGDQGHPTDVVEAPRTLAHRAIEEAMLAANRAVAEHLLAREAPALYRVHEPPLPDALEALAELLAGFGLLEDLRGRRLESIDVARAMQRAAGRPEARLVHFAALRSLRPARYDAACRGHYALAFDAYLHFTSPIRRYADLVVHRALREALQGGAAARARSEARAPRLATWAAALSASERVAMEAERDAVDLKKCVFLRERLGERFDATVTRTSRLGVHATLDDCFIEGLVPARSLPGRWEWDERGFAWRARRGRERLRLGDRVRVAVTRVDLERAWIDFTLLPPEAPPP